jgi:hypothetical protein
MGYIFKIAFVVVYKYMNYLLSIDGNYDSDFEAEFYFNKLKQIYFNDNLQISKYYINSTCNKNHILEKLNEINTLLEKDNNLIFIVGGIAEPIIKDLEEKKQIHSVFHDYEEISRVYKSIKQKCKMTNILLINKDFGGCEGFEKIDSMNIALGFKFKTINTKDSTLMDNYLELLKILNNDGWNIDPYKKI